MKIKELMNEVFIDIAKSRPSIEAQKAIINLSKATSTNPILKDLNADVSAINSNFAALLAQIQQQQVAAAEEQKRRDAELKQKEKTAQVQRAGIGSTQSIAPVAGTGTGNKANT